jgi:Domain of unknown function (DUF4214)
VDIMVAQTGPHRISAAESLTELCSYSDGDFIRCAYLTLLGREPDVSGGGFYLRRLRGGTSKVSILKQLSQSREGKGRHVSVAGLGQAIRWHRLASMPVIGPVLSRIRAHEGGAGKERQLRAIEDLLARQEAAIEKLLEESRTAAEDRTKLMKRIMRTEATLTRLEEQSKRSSLERTTSRMRSNSAKSLRVPVERS